MALSGCRLRNPLLVGIAATALVMAGLGVAVASSRHPQLRPGSVRASGWADPADPLPTEVRVSNLGTASAPKSTLRLYLSADKKQSKHDVRLKGMRLPALRAGKHVSVRLEPRLPRQVKIGAFWVLACVSGHCAPSQHKVHVTSPPKTSADLIDSAHLSAGTKILYKVYAAIGDARLPSKYRGDDPPLFGDFAVAAARDQWAKLSASQRALLSPLLQAPAGPHGYHARARAFSRVTATQAACPHNGPTGMKHVDAPGGQIRVWYPNKGVPHVAAAAPQIAREAASIWHRYKALMGREPPSDASFCGFNGGDGHFDIYLVDNDLSGFVRGYAITTNYKGHHQTGGPSFTVFNCWADDPPDGWELAHELFHAFQFAFAHAAELTSYQGFDEGSADWAANWVYPKTDLEHNDDEMLTYPEDRTFPDNSYGYELWVFDLYLTERFGNQLIPQIYQEFQHEDELTALNSIIPGGFEDRLADFTKYGWNQGPAPDGFRKWDREGAVPSVAYNQPVRPIDLHLGGLESRTRNLPDKLAPLTRAYHAFHLDDHNIRDVVFHNTLTGIQGASVQAFVKLNDGTWRTQNWTDEKTVQFCRDEGKDQNITDLVIMYGNARYQDRKPLNPAKQPTLELRSNCDRYYRVTAVSGTYTENFSITDTTHSYRCTDPGTQKYSYSFRKSAAGTTDGTFTPNGLGLVFVPANISGSDNYGPQTCSGGQPFLTNCTARLSSTDTTVLLGLGTISDTGTSRTVQIPSPDHLGDLYANGTAACDSDWKYGGVVDGDHRFLTSPDVSEKTLEGTQPFTVHGSDTYSLGGYSITRNLRITLQPTDENGTPLQ